MAYTVEDFKGAPLRIDSDYMATIINLDKKPEFDIIDILSDGKLKTPNIETITAYVPTRIRENFKVGMMYNISLGLNINDPSKSSVISAEVTYE